MTTDASEFIAKVAEGAAVYERNLVPVLFEPFGRDLLEQAGLRAGERVLDLGCGTGILASLAAERVGDGGVVVGADLNPGFLAVARSRTTARPIEWVEADAQDLSAFPDGSFDLVVSQQVLQFVPDRVAAAREIRRVLAPAGRALVSVWTAFEETPVYVAMDAAYTRHLGPDAFAPMREAVYGLSDGDALAAIFEEAGFADVEVRRHERTFSFPSGEDYPRRVMEVPPVGDEELAAMDRIVADAAAGLEGCRQPDGSVAFPIFTNVATARVG